mmetsp:Transcript_627/g.1010  ORF Transcript_627/g.1010 Transcript_627/m.1010 type:complete len:472 (+) Transcript_627:42-1457(+)
MIDSKLWLVVLIAPLLSSNAFLVSTVGPVQKAVGCCRVQQLPPHQLALKMAEINDSYNDDNDDDDDDDDGYISDEELGDWRTFRSTLVGNGLSSPSLTDASEEGNSEGGNISKSEEAKEKKVSANVELLFSQSDRLGEEYLSGAWAHEAPDVEVGGLVVRLPLEAEIHKSKGKSLISKELMKRMNTEDEGSSGSSYLSLGSDDKSSSPSPNLSFSLVAARTLLWYKKAQKLIEEEMENISNLANEKGEIDPRQLEPKSESLLNLYLDNQNSWQEVCLVTNRDAAKGSATTFVINRPMAFSASQGLARLLLFGSAGAISDRVPPSQTQLLVKFLNAFENICAVYIGGPDKMDEPATLIHGFEDLEGAEEIAPGTKIYKGGINAAIDGIMSGKYNPLDFRFFVGRHEYKDGELDIAVHASKYQPIACARPIVLKQCMQLPKPLWHEVLELCGGELKELSKLELMKRDDIQEED